MLALNFLEHLDAISLEENQKENQLLSQKMNQRRSSQVAADKLPFRQWERIQKSKKKITFRLLEDLQAEEPNQMESSLAAQLETDKLQLESDPSAMSTHPSLRSKKSSQKDPSPMQVSYPSNFEGRMKILRSLR